VSVGRRPSLTSGPVAAGGVTDYSADHNDDHIVHVPHLGDRGVEPLKTLFSTGRTRAV
jgi:hypothetical protein